MQVEPGTAGFAHRAAVAITPVAAVGISILRGTATVARLRAKEEM
jgi:hypothetical protein